MTIGAFFARQRLRYWLGIVGMLAIILIAWKFFGTPYCWLFVGLTIGALSRDLGQAIRASRFWPTLDSVLNWDAIDQRLSSDSTSPSVGV